MNSEERLAQIRREACAFPERASETFYKSDVRWLLDQLEQARTAVNDLLLHHRTLGPAEAKASRDRARAALGVYTEEETG